MPGRAVQQICLALLFFSASTAWPADTSYTIREGETLFGIAKKTQVPLDVLCGFNGIADAGKLKAGTVIRVPGAYVVKKGDTLYGVARFFGVPLARLLELNGMKENAKIKPGDRLFIPDGARGSAAPQVAEAAGQGNDAEKGTGQGSPPAGSAASASDSAHPPAGILWPHQGRREPVKGKIPGLVFYGSKGDVVHSATGGEVKWVGLYYGLGKTIVIKSEDGTIFLYAGNEELLVNVGDRVVPGSEIARLGTSPQGGGAKLLFSIQGAAGQFIDPEKFFSDKNRA